VVVVDDTCAVVVCARNCRRDVEVIVYVLCQHWKESLSSHVQVGGSDDSRAVCIEVS